MKFTNSKHQKEPGGLWTILPPKSEAVGSEVIIIVKILESALQNYPQLYCCIKIRLSWIFKEHPFLNSVTKVASQWQDKTSFITKILWLPFPNTYSWDSICNIATIKVFFWCIIIKKEKSRRLWIWQVTILEGNYQKTTGRGGHYLDA